MQMHQIWMSILAVIIGLGLAAPASAVTMPGNGDGVLNKTTINNTITESRFTEVMVTNVNGVSGLFTTPHKAMTHKSLSSSRMRGFLFVRLADLDINSLKM